MGKKPKSEERNNAHKLIVEIGSGSTDFILYKTEENGNFERLQKPRKEPIHIVSGCESDGSLKNSTIQEILTALDNRNSFVESTGLCPKEIDLHIFATSAVRDAPNRFELSEKIKDLTGKNLDLLTGDEEGICSALSQLHRNPNTDGILTDIGQSSGEITRIKNGMIWWTSSMPVGAGVLIKQENPEWFIMDHLSQRLHDLNEAPIDNIYWCGGNPKAIMSYILKEGFELTKPDSSPVCNIDRRNYSADLFSLPEDQLTQIFANSRRVESLRPTLFLMDLVHEYFQAEQAYRSTANTAEGYLIRTISSQETLDKILAPYNAGIETEKDSKPDEQKHEFDLAA